MSDKVEKKWTILFDENCAPKEPGKYRIIDAEGTEMIDYFFGEPRITGHGIGYWANCTNQILAWSKLETEQ